MYKIVSRSRTILNVTIVNQQGKEIDACLLPDGYLNSRRITPILQKYKDNRLVDIFEQAVGKVIHNEDYQKPFPSNGDGGATSESISITESTPTEASTEESPKPTIKARGGRRKKVETPVVDETEGESEENDETPAKEITETPVEESSPETTEDSTEEK